MNIPQDQYNFNEYEKEILNFWLKNKFYKPEYNPKTKKVESKEEMEKNERMPFSIICPPPNAYARPHMGNLSGYAYQDAMGRFQRMNGKKVLLLPGKDHAGLEGEGVFVREVLEKEGRNKFEMTREEFYKEIWDFNMVNKAQALKDEQTIGLSADFDRDIFTLDERVVETVLSTFVGLYESNMVYKGVRIINWDPKARSAIADNQCERKEREGSIYTIKYPFVNQRAWKLSLNDSTTLDKIKSSKKSVDFRALNPEEKERYFGDIKVGDILIFADKSESHNPSLYKKVKSVEIYKTLEEAFEKVDWKETNEEEYKDVLDLEKAFASYALGYAEKIRMNGLVAIYFEDLGEKDFITVATTRPETMFGDTAVAVNPTDERYTQLVGKKVIIPLADREIPIIFDPKVEKDFGTGCLKITPAHAQDDYEIRMNWNQLVDKEEHDTKGVIEGPKKEKIGYVNCIDKDLKICGPVSPRYKGQKYNAAKVIVIEDLKNLGLLTKEEKLMQNVLVSERTGALVEPIMSSQWFIDIDKIRKPVIEMVEKGEVKIHPKHMEKKFYHWMENLRDWAISRSLWWGYRIPVWYHGNIEEEVDNEGQVQLWIDLNGEKQELNPADKNHMLVQLENPGDGWIQDEDVLDTWFSSGQWPYATLMAHNLINTFYPTDVLETGFDILENWVSRMMMFSYFKLNKIPFKDVYLHGLVKGTDGQKMSKSRKNIIPMDDVEKNYGIDALRMCYFYQNKAGSSYAITLDKLKNFRNFNNKIWNAAKYVLRSIDLSEIELKDLDKEILNKEKYLKEENQNMINIFKDRQIKTTNHFENFKFGLATAKLYDSFWHEYCDKYIEVTKELLKSEDKEVVIETLSTLLLVLIGYLKLLYPFIPYVTEKIYQVLKENELTFEDSETLMYTKWGI